VRAPAVTTFRVCYPRHGRRAAATVSCTWSPCTAVDQLAGYAEKEGSVRPGSRCVRGRSGILPSVYVPSSKSVRWPRQATYRPRRTECFSVSFLREGDSSEKNASSRGFATVAVVMPKARFCCVRLLWTYYVRCSMPQREQAGNFV
jgi:hypothetical protein